MRTMLVVIALAASGCRGPDAGPPADDVPDASTAIGRVVRTTMSGPLRGTSVVAIPPTADGDQLVVVVALPEGGSLSRQVVAGPGLSSWFLSRAGDGCAATTEVWLSQVWNAPPAGTTSVAIERDDASPYAIDAIEIAGVAGPSDSISGGEGRGAAATGSPIAAESGDLILSTLTTCGQVASMDPASPFVALDVADDGSSVASLAVTAAGTYQAAWSSAGGSWSSTTVRLR